MLDKYQEDQKQFVEEVKRIISNHKLSHAYLIEANNYKEIKELVKALVYDIYLSKEGTSLKDIEITGNIIIIEQENLIIKKDAVVEIKDKFATKSVDNSYQIYVIHDADKLNPQAANSLLKFLEEPEENIIGILVANNRYEVMETLRSRCQLLVLKEGQVDFDFENIERVKIIIETLEEKKVNSIAYLPVNLGNKYLSKEEFYNILISMQTIYEQALRKKTMAKTAIDDKILDVIINNNEVEEILNKIDIIGKYIERLNYNLNTNQLMDSFIINFRWGA